MSLTSKELLSVKEQVRIITKGASEVIQVDELKEKLSNSIKNNKPLIIKFGLDPSAPDIHLGHSVPLRKLRQMQDLGHKVVIIIGDFTGRIGDPTGKSKTRKPLSDEEVKENAKTYLDQLFLILEKEKTEVRFNSEWLSKLNFREVIELASKMTVARMLERDDFKTRFRNNEAISCHEFLYPLMQGYDSLAINADIELGGTDQTFNILMGRTLQKSEGIEQQIALFMPILEGLDGVQKMSKSLNNYIGIKEEAKVMFKKVMEVPDHLVIRYFELVTDEHPDRIDELKILLEEGANPRDIKFELATIITGLYHSKDEVEGAIKYYNEAFRDKRIPEQIKELILPCDCETLQEILPFLVKEQYVRSNSEFRRLVEQGGVSINDERVLDMDLVLIEDENVLKIGKKKFIRLIKSKENK